MSDEETPPALPPPADEEEDEEEEEGEEPYFPVGAAAQPTEDEIAKITPSPADQVPEMTPPGADEDLLAEQPVDNDAPLPPPTTTEEEPTPALPPPKISIDPAPDVPDQSVIEDQDYGGPGAESAEPSNDESAPLETTEEAPPETTEEAQPETTEEPPVEPISEEPLESTDEFSNLDKSPPPEEDGTSESRLLKSFASVPGVAPEKDVESEETPPADEAQPEEEGEGEGEAPIPDGDDLGDEEEEEQDEEEEEEVPEPAEPEPAAPDCTGFVEPRKKPVLELTPLVMTEVQNPDYCVERRLKPVINAARKALAAYDQILACDTFGCNACDPPAPCDEESDPGLIAWLQNILTQLLFAKDDNENDKFPEEDMTAPSNSTQEDDPCA